MSSNAQHAAVFRRLHTEGVLLLANAWDAGSARLIETLGAKAIATTSAGLAWSRGYSDGDTLPFAHLQTAVAEIARVVRVPLTVDVEGGYSDDPAAVADHVERLADLGVVGINLEDGAGPPESLCAKIAAIRDIAARNGFDVFVNARTDVYLRGLAPPEQRVAMVLERAARYREAGADGLFVPGLVEAGDIRTIAAGAGVPLNLLLRAALPPIEELQALGVARLSAGSDLAEAAFGQTRALATAFLADGRAGPGPRSAYGELNALFAPRD